jgi:hypothetical protein
MPAILILAVLVMQVPTPGGAASYRNDTLGIEVTAPPGWTRTPDSVVQARLAKLRRPGVVENAYRIQVEFTRTPGDWFAYPKLVVQVNTGAPGVPMPTPDVIVQQLNSSGTVAQYDTARDAVLLLGHPSEGSPEVAIRAYSAIRVGPRALVAFVAIGFAKDSSATAAILDRFLAGMKVHAPTHGP